MANWIPPKLNWTSTDEVTHVDYNRIKNNLTYINDLINTWIPSQTIIIDLGPDKDYTSNYYPSEFNKMEETLDSFKRIGVDLSLGTRSYYLDNTKMPNASQLQRLERSLLNYKQYSPIPTSVIIDPGNVEIWTKTSFTPETVQLTATVYPSFAQDRRVTWSSSDTSVVTVDSNGLLTRVGHGTAIITATTVSGGCVDNITVHVRYGIDSVDITPQSYTLDLTSGTVRYNLRLLITPSYAEGYTVGWTTTDPAVAVIDNVLKDEAIARGVGFGNCTIGALITQTYFNDTFPVSSELEVITRVQSVKIDQQSPYIIWTKTSYAPETLQLTATVLPATAANRNVTWSSSDTNVATVNSSGLVTRVGHGRAVITATTVDGGLTDNFILTVNYGVDSFSIDPASISVGWNETKNLSYSIVPSYATGYTAPQWASNDTSVVTTSNGSITGVRSGTAVITATISEPNFSNATHSAICNVTCSADISQITFSANPLDAWVSTRPGQDYNYVDVSFSPAGSISDCTLTYDSDYLEVVDMGNNRLGVKAKKDIFDDTVTYDARTITKSLTLTNGSTSSTLTVEIKPTGALFTLAGRQTYYTLVVIGIDTDGTAVTLIANKNTSSVCQGRYSIDSSGNVTASWFYDRFQTYIQNNTSASHFFFNTNKNIVVTSIYKQNVKRVGTVTRYGTENHSLLAANEVGATLGTGMEPLGNVVYTGVDWEQVLASTTLCRTIKGPTKQECQLIINNNGNPEVQAINQTTELPLQPITYLRKNLKVVKAHTAVSGGDFYYVDWENAYPNDSVDLGDIPIGSVVFDAGSLR